MTNYLIIGTGLAGFYAADYASRFGKVILISKDSLQTSSSFWAQGGIASVMDEDDSTDLHYADTMKVGLGLNNEEAVKTLVTEGPERIRDLIKLGLNFDKTGERFSLGMEGGHSRRRILHLSGTETGKHIINFLLDRIIRNKNIFVYENTLVYDLIIENGKCIGCKAYDWMRKNQLTFYAESVLLATGGYAGIYKRSTNPHSSTGDGIMLAYNAGADILNMELIQFHPTAFYNKENGESFLISEAVRGEGAYLLDRNQKRFMPEIDKRAELAPRDIVAYAIHTIMKQQGIDYLYLDLRHIGSDKIKTRFPNIYKLALAKNIDITKELIPVSPSAHYCIGGVETDINGVTSIENLYAAGEVSHTGVHGANRLASNSLLECLVFGKRAIDKINEKTSQTNVLEIEPDAESFFVNFEKEKSYLNKKNTISEILNDHIGIVRDKQNLELAKSKIESVEKDWAYEKNEYYSTRLLSLATLVKLIIEGALNRTESRGVHKRSDYPETDRASYYLAQSKNNKIKKVML